MELYEYTQKSIKEFLNVKSEYLLGVLKKVEIPISFVLADMEKRGIEVDVKYLEKLNDELKDKLEKIKKEIFKTVGHEFNINSPKQLSDVLFNELGLPSTDGMSTREDVLYNLVGSHPCVEKILEYRELSKIFGTYTTPMLQMAKDGDMAIHTDFKQTGTTSGRLSSVNPNMQNLPSDKLTRSCFIVEKGNSMTSADYKSQEQIVLANFSKEENLINFYKKGFSDNSMSLIREI